MATDDPELSRRTVLLVVYQCDIDAARDQRLERHRASLSTQRPLFKRLVP
jgi:hypothetical protein